MIIRRDRRWPDRRPVRTGSAGRAWAGSADRARTGSADRARTGSAGRAARSAVRPRPVLAGAASRPACGCASAALAERRFRPRPSISGAAVGWSAETRRGPVSMPAPARCRPRSWPNHRPLPAVQYLAGRCGCCPAARYLATRPGPAASAPLSCSGAGGRRGLAPRHRVRPSGAGSQPARLPTARPPAPERHRPEPGRPAPGADGRAASGCCPRGRRAGRRHQARPAGPSVPDHPAPRAGRGHPAVRGADRCEPRPDPARPAAAVVRRLSPRCLAGPGDRAAPAAHRPGHGCAAAEEPTPRPLAQPAWRNGSRNGSRAACRPGARPARRADPGRAVPRRRPGRAGPPGHGRAVDPGHRPGHPARRPRTPPRYGCAGRTARAYGRGPRRPRRETPPVRGPGGRGRASGRRCAAAPRRGPAPGRHRRGPRLAGPYLAGPHRPGRHPAARDGPACRGRVLLVRARWCRG